MVSKKNVTIAIVLLFLTTIGFVTIDWSVDGFELFKMQKYEYYFQSWISLAGFIFSAIISITTFIIYKKADIESLKWVSLSFFLTTIAYSLIGYHSSYCQVCSDLSMCSASHNYSNFFALMALVLLVISILFSNLKKNISLLKLFSFGLIIASLLMMVVLAISIEFMEIPAMTLYEIDKINFQGFVFALPGVLILLSMVYFKIVNKISNSFVFVLSLLSLSFLPQAYHIFYCQDCHVMECSEFFIFSGLLMITSVGLVIYAISKQLEK